MLTSWLSHPLTVEVTAPSLVTDYTPALIAVAGTLAGSLLTGIVALVGILVTTRNQKRILKAQLEHAVTEANRTERRQAYSEFIDCMERWNILALEVEDLLESNPELDLDKGSGRSDLSEKQEHLWDRWREALGRVHLIASADVDALASRIFAQYQVDMADAWAGEPNNHSHSSSAGRVYPVTLISKMQADIGVLDGAEIDPDTGLRR